MKWLGVTVLYSGLSLTAQAPKPICTPRPNLHLTGTGNRLDGHWWISANCSERVAFLFGYLQGGGTIPEWPPNDALDRFYKDPDHLNTSIGMAIHLIWGSADVTVPRSGRAEFFSDQPAAPSFSRFGFDSAPGDLTRLPIREIFPPAELKRLQDSADARKRDIRNVLDQMGPRRLNASQKEKVSRIKSLLQLSDEAEGKNDMWTADALAERAQDQVAELLQSDRR
jgi:hypothetical protein